MTIYIVVKDRFQVAALKRILPSTRLLDIRILYGGPGGYRGNAISMAERVRSETGGEPVILLIDAQTVDEESIADQDGDIGYFARSLGPPIRSELVFAVPEVEVVLFHDPEVLEGLLGIEISAEERVEARFIPRKVLARLIERSGRFADATEMVEAMDDEGARRLAAHPLVQQLERLIAEIREQRSVPAEPRLRRTG